MGINKKFNRKMANEKYLILNVMDYSTSPGPRYCNQGDDSGEDFYHSLLNQRFYESLKEKKILKVILDGPDGYASSFLDEAFGNLVYDFGIETVRKNIEFVSNEEPEWISMIQEDTYMEWEERRESSQAPSITAKHDPWYRLIGTQIEKGEWITYAAS